MKKIAIVVLHYKGRNFTRGCLESLAKLKTKNFSIEAIVVDNNSPEPFSDLKVEFKDVTLITNKENLGFAEGNNVGIRQALKNGADQVLILNNDTVVASDFLLQAVKAADEDEKIGIIAPKIYFAPGCEYHKKRYKKADEGKVFWYAGGTVDWNNVLSSHRGVDEVDKGQYEKAEETDFASGCVMLVKRKVFEKIGLFDDRYFLYLEDLDFCQRAKRVGFKVFYAPKAKVWHFNASSSEVGGPLHDYYITRNRMLFGLRYAPLRAKLSLIRESIKLLTGGRGWQKIAIRDFYLRRSGRGSYRGN